jgi:hypothetical protein
MNILLVDELESRLLVMRWRAAIAEKTENQHYTRKKEYVF